jgi:hypothetical protein
METAMRERPEGGNLDGGVSDWSALGDRANAALARTIRAGARSYDRMRDLPGLTRLDPMLMQAGTAGSAALIVARLAAALRAERNRARSGHWTYDLNRHIALRQAYVAESERLSELKGQARPDGDRRKT